MLSAAFEELGLALEALHALEGERTQQIEAWQSERTALDAEIKRYHDLFKEAPIGYIVTSLEGTIRQANAAAAALLQTNERNLVGRSLSLFVPNGQRRPFRNELAEIPQLRRPRERVQSFQTLDGELFEAELIVTTFCGAEGRPLGLRCLIRAVCAPSIPEEESESMRQPSQGSLQQQLAFLADASVVLALAQDMQPNLTHVANLAVPTIADACVIDMVQANGRGQQLVLASAPDAESGTVTRWRNYASTSAEPLQDTKVARGEHECFALIDTCLAHPLPPRDRSALHALQPAWAVAAPLREGNAIGGTLLLLRSSARAAEPMVPATLAEELARRIGQAIARSARC